MEIVSEIKIERILSKSPGRRLTAVQINEIIDVNERSLTRKLTQMCHRGLIKRERKDAGTDNRTFFYFIK